MKKNESGLNVPLSFFCGASLLGFILLLPCAARALTVDDEDVTVGYTEGTEIATTNNVVVVVPGDSGQATQLNYNFANAGTYSQLSKNFARFNLSDLSQSNVSLRFYARGSGSDNRILFRLTDSKGIQVYKTISGVTNNGAWTSYSIPLTSFSTSTVNQIFDYFRVEKVEIAVEKTNGGSGTLDIDKIELYRASASTGVSILLDDFEGGPGVNEFGAGPDFTTQDTNATITATYDTSAGNVAVGSYALNIFYNAGTNTAIDNAYYYNSPNWANLTPATQVEFYAKADNDPEAFRLKLGSSTQYQVVNIGGISKTWKKFIVPFANFDAVMSSGMAGRGGFSSVNEFVMIFTPNVSAGYGNLWIDDIRFTAPVTSSGSYKVIDDMEEPVDPALTSWEISYDSHTTAALSSVADGVSGRALRLTYNSLAGPSSYATLLKKMYVNASLTDAFRFKYKLSGKKTDGSAATNDFEFNVLDVNGTRFNRKLTGFASTDGQWKTLTIPLSDLKKESGSTSLDLRKLTEMRFTLLKSDGGSGILAVDDFEVLNAPKLSFGDRDRLIQNLSSDNNPFSPNGDGFQDTVTFSYSLKETSRVRFRIYDLEGKVIKEFKPDDPVPSGASSFIWNGWDSDSARVKNGLYFYQLKADSTATGASDKETGVVAVLR